MSKIHSKNPIASLSILIFGHFLNHFYAYVFGAAMFVIRNDIVMNNKQIGLLATIQMAVFALCTFAVGVLGDKWLVSKKLFVPLGVFFMALHLIIASVAQSYSILALAAAIVGFGASFYHPVAYAAIADLYENKKGLTMALNAALGMIGTALTPGIIASFSEWIGWRKFFLYFGLGAIVLTFLMFIGFNRLIDYSFEKEELEQIQSKWQVDSGLENIGDISRLGNRICELPGILNESLNISKLDNTSGNKNPPDNTDDDVPDIVDKTHNGHDDTGDKLSPPGG